MHGRRATQVAAGGVRGGWPRRPGPAHLTTSAARVCERMHVGLLLELCACCIPPTGVHRLVETETPLVATGEQPCNPAMPPSYLDARETLFRRFRPVSTCPSQTALHGCTPLPLRGVLSTADGTHSVVNNSAAVHVLHLPLLAGTVRSVVVAGVSVAAASLSLKLKIDSVESTDGDLA